MNISFLHTWPKSTIHKLAGIFITEDKPFDSYTLQLNKWLNEEVSIVPKQGENGYKYFHHSEGQALLSLGLGKNPNLESYRKSVHDLIQQAQAFNYEELILILDEQISQEQVQAMAESASLSTYRFETYKTDVQPSSLSSITFLSSSQSELEKAFQKGLKTAEAAQVARDLVNEPVITLTAEALAERTSQLGTKYGFQVDVWHKPKIEAMKMGGLLAVNSGSQDPPTFSILEYKPSNPQNKKPIILVGKGVVFDTGGLSLKPTANSMDFMKADMAGAAAVVGTFCGIAALNLNYHVIGLVPATDNRPGQRAYTPGDVILMHDGSTVEVLNTDAEGRMILADALSFAKKYDPEVVIDLATLTGAAVVAVGHEGVAMMSNSNDSIKDQLKTAGENVYERLVELPLWEEYKEQLKSDIADLKNIGGRGAGAITAGKFLEHFTDYPWIHLDIAGASWLPSPSSYRGKNGTGVGVRLLIEFISNFVSS